MVGLFINTLPVRVTLAGGARLMPWLQMLQAGQAEMRQYDYSPLVQIQGWSEVPRQNPLFESNLVFFNLPGDTTANERGEDVSSREAKSGLAARDLNVRAKMPTNIPLTLKSIPGTCLQLEILYDRRRFEATTIARVLDRCRELLEYMVAQPGANLQNLKEMLSRIEMNEKMTEKSRRKESELKRFMSIKPKAVSLSREKLIKTSSLKPGQKLPLVVEPNAAEIDLVNWSKNNLDFVEQNLLEHGGILFRGFDVESLERFDEFTRTFSSEQLEYIDQHTPRTRLAGKIYTSTEYPAEHYVPFHSENSKNHAWPMKIWFHCVQPAVQGGETPIADNHQVFELLDPHIRAEFMRKNVMYVRNFGEGLGLPWQTVFQTSERSEVEAYCREVGVEFQWKDENRLRTRHVCQAVATHPRTGKTVWFNQAHLFHVSSLEPAARESLLSLFTEDELPSNAYYGDGTPIEDYVIQEIREAFNRAAVSFPWQERDILMLDNMAVAHGRAPYVGTRRIVVAMAEAFDGRLS
jgi:alpha-ketoglutarate-dependent taurine dioxygenase